MNALREALDAIDRTIHDLDPAHENQRIGLERAYAVLFALAAADAEPEPANVCLGHCGTLDWTVRKYGRITHKHVCPHRTTPFCQSHPDGCADAAPEPDPADALREALCGDVTESSGIRYRCALPPHAGVGHHYWPLHLFEQSAALRAEATK